jgi:hypothetical protein
MLSTAEALGLKEALSIVQDLYNLAQKCRHPSLSEAGVQAG